MRQDGGGSVVFQGWGVPPERVRGLSLRFCTGTPAGYGTIPLQVRAFLQGAGLGRFCLGTLPFEESEVGPLAQSYSTVLSVVLAPPPRQHLDVWMMKKG